MSASLTTRSSSCRVLNCLDRSGSAVSTLCAFHCACMPTVVALVPAAWLGSLADESTEVGLLVMAALLGLAGLSLGYRVHRSPWVVLTIFTGFGLIALGRLAEGADREAIGAAGLVAGGLTVAGAHLLSHRLRGKPGQRSIPADCPVGRSG